MSQENIKNIAKSDSNFAPTFVDYHVLQDLNFNGHCLINNIYIPKKVISIYISYTLNPHLKKDFTLSDCLFGSLKVTENADLDKCKYYSYGIGFDSPSKFSFTDGSFGKKCHYVWS